MARGRGFEGFEGLKSLAARLPSSGRRRILVACLVVASCGTPPTPAPDAGSDDPGRSAGNERMARRLAVIADNTAQANVFMNEEHLTVLRQATLPEDPVERIREELNLANECLRAGLSEEATQRLAAVLAKIEADPSAHPSGLVHRVGSLLAVAHLRLGEQENCLLRHNSDACLMPIRESGRHQLPRGSRAALEQLTVLLEQDARDVSSLWLYNVAAMTLGEYPEGVPEAWRVPPEAFASDFDIGRFRDVAPAVGLATVGLAGGVVIDDLDGDDLPDVMVSSWGLRDPLRFFRQRRAESGAVRFEERTREAGLEGLNGGLNLVQADYDNDGDVDVLVLRGAWLQRSGLHPNSLLRNDGGVFSDVTEEAGVLSYHPTQTAAWGDFDNDGWLDLYVGNESTPGEPHLSELYRNNGPGSDGQVSFTDVARKAGVAAGGFVKGVVWGDFDNDGLLDLYRSQMRGANLLFHNQGPGADSQTTFTEMGSAAGVAKPDSGFPTWFFDFDNDGDLDLFACGYGKSFLEAGGGQDVASYFGIPSLMEKPRLYRNDGDGRFSDVTAAMDLDHPMLGMGANFGDLDSDGWLDLYIGTGAPDYRALVPNRMFRNDRGRTFQDVTTSGGFGHLQKGHGVAFADIDQDGDQDVFAVLGGAFSGDVYPNALFANPGHGHHWVALRLRGTSTNRSAIGARIRLEVEAPNGRRQIHATVSSGGSFGASSLEQHVGLGDAEAIVLAEVRWPGGGVEIFRDLPLDQAVLLEEGQAKPQVLRRTSGVLPSVTSGR